MHEPTDPTHFREDWFTLLRFQGRAASAVALSRCNQQNLALAPTSIRGKLAANHNILTNLGLGTSMLRAYSYTGALANLALVRLQPGWDG